MDAWEYILIIFWVTITLFIGFGAYLTLRNRKMSKKMEKMQQKLSKDRDIIHELKKSEAERRQELEEVHYKVDKMIEKEQTIV